MKQSDGGYAPSYNVQISTDAQQRVIVAAGVSQSASDYPELVPAEQRIEQQWGRAPEQMGVDRGFTSRANILAMEQCGVDLMGSLDDGQAQSAGQLKRRGVDAAFGYDPASDTYRCPAGQTLKYESQEKHPGVTAYHYRGSAADHACPLKPQCCPQNASKGQSIVRSVEDPVVEAFREKMKTEAAQQIYRQRGAVAEFPNAWIKEKLRLRQFRLRGLVMILREVLWACLNYNVQQWICLRWRPRLELAKAAVS
jgi:hypothetical protein